MALTNSMQIYLNYCNDQKRLDAKTQKAYRIDLRQLSEALNDIPPEQITVSALEAVIADWHNTYKPKTVKRKMASIKAFFTWLSEKEYITENPFIKIHVKFREPKTLPRTIPEHDIKTFLTTMYQTYHNEKTPNKKKYILRDIAVIETLFAAGIRISELCKLTDTDVNLIEGTLLIHGKGRKERIIQMPDQATLTLLKTYKETWQTAIQKHHRFFVNNRERPLSDSSVRNIINHYQEKAGIQLHITPHMFRHTFATMLLESDVNLRCIQEILGHSSIQTTEIYTHVSAAKQRQILNDHHPRKQIDVHL